MKTSRAAGVLTLVCFFVSPGRGDNTRRLRVQPTSNPKYIPFRTSPTGMAPLRAPWRWRQTTLYTYRTLKRGCFATFLERPVNDDDMRHVIHGRLFLEMNTLFQFPRQLANFVGLNARRAPMTGNWELALECASRTCAFGFRRCVRLGANRVCLR